MSIRKTLAAALGALVVASGITLPATTAQATTQPTTPRAAAAVCMPTSGVGAVSPATPHKPLPVDDGISVYVGGNFTRKAGAELEGRLAVRGNADFGSGLYNLGTVGAGSGLIPTVGSDIVTVGGNVTITGPKLDIKSTTAAGAVAPGNLVAGGTIVDPKFIEEQHPESKVISGVGARKALGDAVSGWADNDFAWLKELAQRNAQGTPGVATVESWGTLTLSGTAGKTRHHFTIPASQLVAGKSLALNLENIAETDIVVVEVTGGPSATLPLNTVMVNNAPLDTGSKSFGQRASRMLWTFPDASNVNIEGTAQVPGSVIVPTAGSKTRVAVAGTNGRYWVAGDLTQDYGGSEFHNFPFLGDPDITCEPPAAPEVKVAPVAPTVTQAVCDAATGRVTAPLLALAETAGISYRIVGEVAAGKTVKVIATATGKAALEAASGWTLAEDGTASMQVVLEDVPCEKPLTPVAPVTPVVTQAVCDVETGETSAPLVTVAETEGVSYKVVGEVAAGKTVTVVATAAEGAKLTAAEGWTLAEDGTASFVVKLAEVECEKPLTPVAPVAPVVTQAVCDVETGETSAPLVTVAETEGVSYKVVGEVAAGKTVTVVATAAKGAKLTAAEGWTLAEDGTASMQVVLEDVPCEKPLIPVAPVAPVVTQAVCDLDSGIASDPSIELATTEGVEYRVNGAVRAGNTVTIVATPAAGVKLTAAEGWTLAEDGTASFDVALEDVPCETPLVAVAPIAPAVTQAVCDIATGETSAPLVTVAETEGVSYEVIGEVAAGKTVTVVATPAAGMTLAEAEGWELNANGTASFVVTLAEIECEQPVAPVAPVAPVVTQAVCDVETGSLTAPLVTVAETEGVSYEVIGEVAAGKTVTVVATPAAGMTLAEAEGWELNANGTASFVVTLAEVECLPVGPGPEPKPEPKPEPEPEPKPEPKPEQPQPGQPQPEQPAGGLAVTGGVGQAPLWAAGLTLLIVGGLLVARRRQGTNQG